MSLTIIAGLGNPGKQYEKTRHNIGFLVIDALAEQMGTPLKADNKFYALCAKGYLPQDTDKQHPVLLVQPQTYMNRSGEVLQKILHYYQLPPQQLLVIYDEAALPFGTLRLRGNGSAGGHNGIKSIIQCLSGNQEFPRVRIGIDSPPPYQALESYVLAPFSKEEQETLPKLIETAAEATVYYLTSGLEAAQSHFNGPLL